MPKLGSDLLERAAARRELTIRRARRDFAAFVEYVFGWKLAAHHFRWVEAVAGHPRVVILAPIEHGKTSLLSIAYPVWLLGQNPNLRIGLISETFSQATRPLAAIRQTIIENPRLKEVFPELRPAVGGRARWTDHEILVKRSRAEKDPSILALGVMGPLLGARLDVALLDDVTSWENSFTAAQRQKLITWFKSTLVGRVVDGGRIIAIGTPWDARDLLHELERSGEYHVVRDPALNENGEPLWPETWSAERLKQRRREIGELEFSRQMLLQVVSDATSRFKTAWLDRAFCAADDMGVTFVESYSGPHPTFSGVDLGVGQGPQHAESAIFTVAVLPDGRRQVLNVEAGRWQAPELIQRLKDTHQRYRSRIRVESNAAQAYIVQFLAADGVPVDGQATGRNRHDPRWGIESLAVELEANRWIIPEGPETRTWARELLAYSPTGHPGDRVIAGWLAREAARSAEAAPLLPPFLLSDQSPPQRPGVVRLPGWFTGQPDSEGDLERDVLSGCVPISYRIDG